MTEPLPTYATIGTPDQYRIKTRSVKLSTWQVENLLNERRSLIQRLNWIEGQLIGAGEIKRPRRGCNQID